MSYDVLVIGGGPAGLSAALNVRARGRSVLVVTNPPEENPLWRAERVDNYLGMGAVSGAQMLSDMRAQAEAAGVEFLTGRALNASYMMDNWYVSVGSDMYNARAVVLSGGVARGKKFPGEQEYLGRGVSYCATCDGAFFRGKTVAVIGGGDVAVEDAIFLARACEKVYLIHRRDSLRAAQSLQNTMLALPNVEVCCDSVVESINGDGQVSSLTMLHKPSGERRELPLQGVFIAVGIKPNSESFISNIASDEKGYLIAGEDCATSMPGVFAAGDIRTKKLRQIVTAVADGANAVEGVQEYFLQ